MKKLYKGKLKVAESGLVSALLEYCDLQERLGHLTYIRNNTGQAEYQDKRDPDKKRKVNYGREGSPDLLIFVKGGITLFFECKSSDGRTSPGQRRFAQKLTDLRHRAYFIRDTGTGVDLINSAIKGA